VTPTTNLPALTHDDPFLHDIDKLKKRALAIFSFLATVLAISIVLVIEVSTLVEVYHLKFPPSSVHAQPTGTPTACPCHRTERSP
jgi:hypothetical protein